MTTTSCFRVIFYSFLLLVFCLKPLTAEDYNRKTFEGRLVNENNEAVANAFLVLEGTNYNSISDYNGLFIFRNVSEGEYNLIIQILGYETTKIAVNIQHPQSEELIINLKSGTVEMPQITVLRDRYGLFDRVPGSVSVIRRMEIEQITPVSGNEIFRNTPGVHAVEEEGIGLRANIGIRGLDPSRSRSVLMLEDGIPVALNPYGEPEMYYTPPMERMEGVEIIKGSGSILFGPQTIGGVINYITADPPEEQEGLVNISGGQGGLFHGMVQYGNSFGNSGIVVSYLRKQANDVGGTNYRVNDLNTKLRFRLSERSTLGFKIGIYDETSNSTYVGMTTSMYESGDYDFKVLMSDDKLDVKKYTLSATHQIKFNENLKLNTTSYGYTTTRNWRRQDYSYSPTAANQTGQIYGDTTISGGAIYMQNSTGNRNRQFEVAGIEPRLSAVYHLGTYKNELETGIRLLYERAFEQRINGTKANASSGSLTEDEIRTGYAFSSYLQNRFVVNSRLSFTAGVRLENYIYERNILRRSYPVGIDGANILVDTSIVSNNSITTIIPGGGFSYRFARLATLFGGVHRGYAPPRVKDAISNTGEVFELDAEDSWNFELGVRSTPLNGLSFEVAGFLMDFNNQIIPVAEAAGGAGAGLINAGATRHVGAEFGFSIDPAVLANTKWSVQLNASMTYVHAYFNEDRFVGSEGVNVKNNKTPYAPELLLYNSLRVTSPFNWFLYVHANYTGKQFTDPLNTVEATANGRNGLIPSYFVLNATSGYTIEKWNTILKLSVKNLTDERYITSRRPQGIKLGLPKFITAGIDFKF